MYRHPLYGFNADMYYMSIYIEKKLYNFFSMGGNLQVFLRSIIAWNTIFVFNTILKIRPTIHYKYTII